MNSNQQSKWINHPFLFALGAMAINLLMLLFQTYSNVFYVEELGLEAIYATLAKVVLLIFDAVISLYAAFVSDRNRRNQTTRRYQYLASTAPFYCLFTVAVFLPGPSWPLLIVLFFFLTTMLGYQLTATFQFINYGALFPQIYHSRQERVVAANWRQALTFIGMVVGIGLPPLLFHFWGYFQTALVLGIVYFVLIIIFLLSIREPEAVATSTPITLKDAFRLLKNRTFFCYHLANGLIVAITGILITVYPFLAEYYLKIEGDFLSLIFAVLFTFAVGGTFIWRLILKRIHYLEAWLAAIVILCGSILSLFFIQFHLGYIFISMVMGFGLAGIFMIPTIITSRLIDEDSQRIGYRREALFNAIANLISKISMIIAAIFFGAFTLIFGYHSGDNPGPNPALMFRILVCVVPVILGGLAFALGIYFRYLVKTNQKQQKMDS